MDQATPAPAARRLLTAGLVALVALLAAIGVYGFASANAAPTSGASAPSYQPVQSTPPESAPPAGERRDGRDCPKGEGARGDERQDGTTTPTPAPDTAPSV